MAGVKSAEEEKSPLKLADEETATMLILTVGWRLGWGPRLHAVAPSPDAVPAAHGVQRDAPAAPEYESAGQAAQTPEYVAATLVEKKPAAQPTHAAEPAVV